VVREACLREGWLRFNEVLHDMRAGLFGPAQAWFLQKRFQQSWLLEMRMQLTTRRTLLNICGDVNENSDENNEQIVDL